MNWHETIVQIRTNPNLKELVQDAYLSEDLVWNVEQFEKSDEFKETLRLFNLHNPGAKKILDVGSGNGITAINFARKGYQVTVVEPDPSDSVGAQAIQYLKDYYHLDTLEIYQQFAEDIGFADGIFDIVYVRQAMHHAYDLNKFVKECGRVVMQGGILVTTRDHVIFDAQDKERFLANHPLHRFYGGENAFTADEYKGAMQQAGFDVIQELKFLDSVINYAPLTDHDVQNYEQKMTATLKTTFAEKLGSWAIHTPLFWLYKMKNRHALTLDEKAIPGRIYSYVARKL